MADLEKKVEEFVRLKREMVALEEKLTDAHKALIETMVGLQLKTIADDEHNCTLTVVNGTRMTFLASALKTVLPARIWKNVRVDAIDSNKMKGYIAAGELTVEGLGDGVLVTITAPSIRMTEGKPATKKAAQKGGD